MIKIGMCDDDLNAVKLTARFLESEIIEQNLDAEITLVTNNQKEIFNAIYNYELDVLFLDIDFKNGGKNGLEFAHILRKINTDFFLIFLTAHQIIHYLFCSRFAFIRTKILIIFKIING